ncbi:hypothetical protein PHYBLDRAFT_164120 [Phycomyces blakesleeanus NRRL 1555(-)]|uniref:Uncharacterized protein n=1 Tax=Phycomyces blakesleeanus (strain ATCC 8743b / DSM 1359 / FGSC 10004 / NBRC 33097 / NRRL 1555) TaxID=763407 RepID=A0A167Q444_PHYB8|nr:hypothetical protein PHYBLDRAFT_164120 [Phycomyces blakesleeanus NRRL 1555(-)]OAD79036.1 hypothetical protein PHYBLDRAFT_164120 [Phycomyces blakesleeanus NRRL 1555(-)]|eukprot:XP_018297076.1 hypothetical protein PHYBLDRAFT_164120 [Phycomyces blakesleeanus NRRL 1555(-)]
MRQEIQRRKEFEISFSKEFQSTENEFKTMIQAVYDFSDAVFVPKKIKASCCNIYKKEMSKERKPNGSKYTAEEIITSYNSLSHVEKERYSKIAENVSTLHEPRNFEIKEGVKHVLMWYFRALGLPTKLAPYRSDTVYPAMIATTLSQYEYVLICDKSNIRVSGLPHLGLMNAIYLALGYESLFLFWKPDNSHNSRIGHLSAGETALTLLDMLTQEKFNKTFFESTGFTKIWRNGTGEVRETLPWKKLASAQGTIRVVGWPTSVPIISLSYMTKSQLKLLIDSLDKRCIPFCCSLEGYV